jgi:subtilisin family serine protease
MILASAVVLPAAGAAGDPAQEDFAILLKSGTINPLAGDYTRGLAFLSANHDRPAVHMLVQLNEIPDESGREALAARGLRLLSYLPHKTWMARVPVGMTSADLREAGVRWLAPMELQHKVSWRVLRDEYGPWSLYADGQRIFVVMMHEDVSAEEGRSLLETWTETFGGYVEALNAYIVVLEPEIIPALALEDEVRWISQRPPVLTDVNDGIREALGVDAIYEPPYNLDGTSVNVLVYDGGLVGDHPDFGTRVTQGEGGGVSNHATHVAGTVAGDGTNSDGLYMGMAPGALITSYLYEACDPYCLYNSPQDIEENYTEGLWTYGADFATNSIGSNIAPNGYDCDWEGDYELTAQLVDAISCGSLGVPFLSVWAAGNERHYGRCGVTYYTTGVPATAKDIIAVGATMSNDHSMSWFSSWGPVDDGRIRPDICAPGCQSGGDGGITSTQPGGSYASFCGTSMATPATSGCIALILEQMRHTPGGAIWPLPSMMKALLINTAQDYFNEGPDFQFGYGEIRPQAAIDVLRDGLTWLDGTIDQGGQHQYQFNVTEAMGELKATVAWSDPPGEQLAEIELVNNIDIYFESPGSAIHQPWILDPQNPDDPATRGVDFLNPVEQVLVDDPEPGVWTLHVTGTDIPEGPQTYSLVANLPRYHGASDVDVPGEDEAATDAGRARLGRNYPNPFGGMTTIEYAVDAAGATVRVGIRDVTGRVVRTLTAAPGAAGAHQLVWDGCDADGHALPAGVYFYRVAGADQKGGQGLGQRMLILR